MDQQAPAAIGKQVDIRGEDRIGRPRIARHGHMFDHAVYRQHAPGEHAVSREPQAQPRALCKNLPPGFAYFDYAAVACAARMHADDVLFVGPYRHHFDEVRAFEGAIKGLLGILRSGVIVGDHISQ